MTSARTRPARTRRADPVTRAAPDLVMPDRVRAGLVGTACTLNGEPARITGARGDAFATIVGELSGARELFGWFTAGRILAQGGTFATVGTHWPIAPTSAPLPDRMPPGYERYARR